MQKLCNEDAFTSLLGEGPVIVLPNKIYFVQIGEYFQCATNFTCISLQWSATVKPPNKEHIGDGPFVPCREVVLFSEI